jgi:riboflavin synthase
MFTGIIEEVGRVLDIHPQKDNRQFLIKSTMLPELQVDQSVSHNGVCLTVVELRDDGYMVTAIEETLEKSNLGDVAVGDTINLERSMKIGGRLDGHIVQGHVDQVAACVGVTENKGSWTYDFEYDHTLCDHVMVEKGSITVNGVSLTCFNVEKGSFSVAIIPYTYAHTNFKELVFGSKVNLEFDVIGKYVAKLVLD